MLPPWPPYHAWSQRLNIQYDELLSNVASNASCAATRRMQPGRTTRKFGGAVGRT